MAGPSEDRSVDEQGEVATARQGKDARPQRSRRKAAEPAEGPGVHRPRRWLAVVLSLFTAGLGHAYVGAAPRAVWLLLSLLVPALAGGALMPHLGRAWGVALLLVLPAGVARLITAVDVARMPAQRLRPARGGRTALRVVLGWVAFSGITTARALLMRNYLVESFKIPGWSMAPTLASGDHIFVDKKSRDMTRGDLVVFRFPEKREQDFVKRIVAVGNDVVELDEQGALLVNGTKLPRCHVGSMRWPGQPEAHEPATLDVYLERSGAHVYLIAHDQQGVPQERFGPFVVPQGEVFVLGDNRDNAYDSRGWADGHGRGVPVGDLKGRAFAIFFAFRPDGDVDLGRVGLISAPTPPAAAEELRSGLARCLASMP